MAAMGTNDPLDAFTWRCQRIARVDTRRDPRAGQPHHRAGYRDRALLTTHVADTSDSCELPGLHGTMTRCLQGHFRSAIAFWATLTCVALTEQPGTMASISGEGVLRFSNRAPEGRHSRIERLIIHPISRAHQDARSTWSCLAILIIDDTYANEKRVLFASNEETSRIAPTGLGPAAPDPAPVRNTSPYRERAVWWTCTWTFCRTIPSSSLFARELPDRWGSLRLALWATKLRECDARLETGLTTPGTGEAGSWGGIWKRHCSPTQLAGRDRRSRETPTRLSRGFPAGVPSMLTNWIFFFSRAQVSSIMRITIIH